MILHRFHPCLFTRGPWTIRKSLGEDKAHLEPLDASHQRRRPRRRPIYALTYPSHRHLISFITNTSKFISIVDPSTTIKEGQDQGKKRGLHHANTGIRAGALSTTPAVPSPSPPSPMLPSPSSPPCLLPPPARCQLVTSPSPLCVPLTCLSSCTCSQGYK